MFEVQKNIYISILKEVSESKGLNKSNSFLMATFL